MLSLFADVDFAWMAWTLPISAALINLNPLVSTGLAVLLLGEHVTLPILAGTVVIIAGTTLLSI